MKPPSLQVERKLWKKGFKRVACLDEAGRGCLSGPVVAAAVIINSKTELPFMTAEVKKRTKSSSPFKSQKSKLQNLKDSKKLTPPKREEFYKIITKNLFIEWGVGRVSEKVIDKINILEATKLAMIKAIRNLKTKKLKNKKTKIDFLVLDGKMRLNLPIAQESIVKADEKVFSCAAASVIAKVTRDRIMQKYHKKYPGYGFNKHKGYPTKHHIKMLKKYGPCKIHRKTFGPLKRFF